MRQMLRVACVVAVAVSAGSVTIKAQCSDFPLYTRGEFLVSNPNWQGGGGAETCTWGGHLSRGCYEADTDGGPISENIQGFFWALGSGNPEIGQGDDSGAFAATDWTKAAVYPGLPNGTYYYPGWLTLDDGAGWYPNYYPGSTPTWTSGPADGCITNGPVLGPNGRPCECLALSDQWGDQGYFLVVGDEVDVTFLANFESGTPGPGGANFGINANNFAPIPPPEIIGETFDPSTGFATIEVRTASFTDGVRDPECGCTLGYKIVAQVVPAGAPPPLDRSEGWIEPTTADGQPQGVTPPGGTTIVRLSCSDEEVYLAIRVIFDSGFELTHVSGSPAPYPCALPAAVEIDIKPDGFPNSVNPRGRGLIPVAVLGSESLNVTDIDVTSLRFGPNDARTAHNLNDSFTYNDHLQDVNLDGFMDLVTHYRVRAAGIACGDDSATLTGQIVTRESFEGSDSIRTVGCRRGRQRFRIAPEPE